MDYVVKPVLRRASSWPASKPCCGRGASEPAEAPRLTFDGLEIRRCGAERPGRRPRGRSHAARVRPALLHGEPRRNRLLPRAADGARVAFTSYEDSSTVTVHIRRLRAKVECDPREPLVHPDRVGNRLQVRAMRRSLLTLLGRSRGHMWGDGDHWRAHAVLLTSAILCPSA